MRLTRRYEHNPHCQIGCETMYCAEHRIVYQWCLTAEYSSIPSERGLWDGGECPECISEWYAGRAMAALKNVAPPLERAVNE